MSSSTTTSSGRSALGGRVSSEAWSESAVRTGMVDYVGSPEEIAAVILRLPEIGRGSTDDLFDCWNVERGQFERSFAMRGFFKDQPLVLTNIS